jgi:2-octaprenyl-6-methoxyphenol hydroxylase
MSGMERDHVDIFISGAGPAGLIAAAVLADLGQRVLVADPGSRPGPEGRGDLRSTAFLRPARELFQRIGLWDALAARATPLIGLQVVDLAGEPPVPRTERLFQGDADGPLGWNFMNDDLTGALLAHLDRQERVEISWQTGFSSLANRSSEALVTLASGRSVRARLAVAADGRASPLREAAGIGVRVTRYGQKALAFAVTHDHPHGNISTESYLKGGAFTMVPLPDAEGQPASAVVWMNPGPKAVALAALQDDEFSAEATRRSGHLLGALRLATRRALWPVVTQRAHRLVEGRVALVAEAAHVLPPIGAQGLNTSVNDIAALADAIGARPGDAGAPAVLARYEAARVRDIAARALVIDLFNRVTRSPDALSQALRQFGLKAVHDLTPLRQGVMRAGMGPPGR